MAQRIKPCAHCGCKDVEFSYSGISRNGQFITLKCQNKKCGCSFSVWTYGDYSYVAPEDTYEALTLIERWNKRSFSERKE